MRLADVLRIALSALFQQKVRTLLTMAGVVIGTFALAVSLSLGRGFEAEVLRQVNSRGQLRQVVVWPSSEFREADIPSEELEIRGEMSEAKRERLRKGLIRRYRQRGVLPRHPVALTPERVDAVRRLEHVESVQPLVQERFRVTCEGAPAREVRGVGVRAGDEQYRGRLLAGEFPPSDAGRGVVVGEYLLWRWGITRDEDVHRVVGRTLRLEYTGAGRSLATPLDALGGNPLALTPDERATLEKALRRLPAARDRLDLSAEEMLTLARLAERFGVGSAEALAALQRLRVPLYGAAAAPLGPLPVLPYLYAPPEESLFAGEFVVTGVFREFTEEDDGLGLTASMMSKNADLFLPLDTACELFLLAPRNRTAGFDGLVITVDHEDNVKEVGRKVRDMGLQEFSLGDWMQRVRTNLRLTTIVTSFLAVTALIVAGLGITNTMIMSVLERRREIGVMKAVGARDGHIQFIFLVEGALIGGLGGALGMLASWLVSFPGDAVARQLLSQQNEIPLKGTLFVYPAWLTLGVPLFACLVTTLAAMYPAWRASRVNPIAALRHE